MSHADDLLYIEDFITLRQRTSSVTVAFEDDAVADHFDAMVDRGKAPSQFARVWLHTHPGSCPNPSSTDEMTFDRVFGSCDWALMFIIARSGQSYARLRFSAGPQAAMLLPVAVDWSAWPQTVVDLGLELGHQAKAWLAEFEQNICPEMEMIAPSPRSQGQPARSSGLLAFREDSNWEIDPEMAALAQMDWEEQMRREEQMEAAFEMDGAYGIPHTTQRRYCS